jgi:hypothetical protein
MKGESTGARLMDSRGQHLNLLHILVGDGRQKEIWNNCPGVSKNLTILVQAGLAFEHQLDN